MRILIHLPVAAALTLSVLPSCGNSASPASDGAVDAGIDATSPDAMSEKDAPLDNGSNPMDEQRADAVTEPDAPLVDCEQSLTDDFEARDELPQSEEPASAWYTDSRKGTWGPKAAQYPSVDAPLGCEAVAWKRARVLAVANKYVGLPYQHHHIPAWDPSSAWADQEGPGLDCSNFTAWVYNYALGLKFISNVEGQADGTDAPGRRLESSEPLEPADLLFILNEERTAISHAVLYIDAQHIIDSTGPGVQVRSFAGWYQNRYSHARRVLE